MEDVRLPPLSLAGRGGAARGHCPQRVRMLYLPLATPAEARDAAVAQRWLQDVASVRPNMPGTADEARVIARYWPLFQPRTLLCGACLNLYFASDPFKAHANRARWKLRNGLGDRLTPNERRALGLAATRDDIGSVADDAADASADDSESASLVTGCAIDAAKEAADSRAMTEFYQYVRQLRQANDELEMVRRLVTGEASG